MAKLWMLCALLATFAISTPAMAAYNWDGFPIQRGAADNAASCNGIPSTPSDNL